MIQQAHAAEVEIDPEAEPVEKIALSAKEAAQALSLGERTLWALTNSGQVPAVRIGRKVLYPVHLLREYLTDLHAQQNGRH